MRGSLYSRVNWEVSFDEFMRIITNNSLWLAQNAEFE